VCRKILVSMTVHDSLHVLSFGYDPMTRMTKLRYLLGILNFTDSGAMDTDERLHAKNPSHRVFLQAVRY